MIRNKKGLMIIEVLMMSYAAGLVLLSAAVRPEFIVQKYVAKCIYQGQTSDFCKEKASAATQDERIAFIRDTASNPTPDDLRPYRFDK